MVKPQPSVEDHNRRSQQRRNDYSNTRFRIPSTIATMGFVHLDSLDFGQLRAKMLH